MDGLFDAVWRARNHKLHNSTCDVKQAIMGWESLVQEYPSLLIGHPEPVMHYSGQQDLEKLL